MLYFKNGLEVVAKNLNLRLCKMNVVICKAMIKTPIATPVIKKETKSTFPQYSGERISPCAPNDFKKLPPTVLYKINQGNSST